MSIASTRMYRTLSDFVYGSTDIALDSLQRSGRSVSKTMQSTTAQDSQNQTEIMVHTTYVQYPMPQTSDRSLVTSTEREEHYKPNELIADEDLEKHAEDRITVV
ncbi:hypothetical protein BJV74DRAFT_886136 [Russula compacta]|nr:hypothetical protein BJV74DRAFT_886136 [Russula compacta]